MRADLFSKDVQEFLRVLASHDVRYLIVGGTAVIYHGYGRMTGDVDFVYDCSAENAKRMWEALREFWRGSVPEVESADELADPRLVVQFGRPPNRIDLIAQLPAIAFDDAWQARVREHIECGGARIPVWVLDLANLRRTKQAAGRPKDIDDLNHLPKA